MDILLQTAIELGITEHTLKSYFWDPKTINKDFAEFKKSKERKLIKERLALMAKSLSRAIGH
jgi:hypothetical protein